MGEAAIDYNQLRMMKYHLESSLMDFTRFIFKERTNKKFIVNWHHELICETLMKVINGDISRLILDLPPGYTKTELAVISFILYGITLNHRSKFIHGSYSDSVALENSSIIKEVIESDFYQNLWPMSLKVDKKGKKRWDNNFDGGLYAVSAKGSVTGFRAGRMEKEYGDDFTGAIVLDDPIKPDDAFSKVKREAVNRNYTNTLKNRVALEKVPIILIMQRLHVDDLAGFLLKGGSEEYWHHLEIPALIDNKKKKYPKEYSYGIPIEYECKDGPLWKHKHTLKQLKVLRKSDKYTFAGQYQQRPTIEGGSLFETRFFEWYKSYNPSKGYIVNLDGERVSIKYVNLYADTAMKAKEVNDFSAMQAFGMGEDGRIYLLDAVRGKWEAPDLEDKFLAFCDKHEFEPKRNILGLQNRKVEDKASGTGLIQSINMKRGDGYIEGIQRNIDKVTRARSCAPKLKQGLIALPKDEYWIDDYLAEFEEFSPTMSHRYDDQIDATMDAIHDMLINTEGLEYIL